jgi:alginate O-acetyltransferase complex protein AlgI
MLFNSLEFLIFFPIVVLIYFIIPVKIKNLWLLAASYYFYMCWNPEYALLILFSTAVTYGCGILLDKIKSSGNDEKQKEKKKKICVAASFAVNLAILFVFKYAGWALQLLSSLAAFLHIGINVPSFDILLPVGISFYTFQALGYTVDVYREDIAAEKNFIQYALFVSFFPQLVAGPIERSGNLLSQLETPHKFSFDNLREGLLLMIWGYFQKVYVADRISVFVDSVYGSDYGCVSGTVYAITAVLFTFQIYCDFSGYSCIAKGAAKVLDIELMENFNAPLLAQTVSEYWRRWHISLSTWFRDYLYIPLGGNRKGRFRKYLNIMITFTVSGLWHGASMHYVVWGILHCIYQVVGDLMTPVKSFFVKFFGVNTASFSHKLLRIVFTFSCIVFSYIFFRAESLGQSVYIIKNIFLNSAPWELFDGTLCSFGLTGFELFLMFIGILILTAADICKYNGISIEALILKQDWWFRILIIIASICFIFYFGAWGSSLNGAEFIYFQF